MDGWQTIYLIVQAILFTYHITVMLCIFYQQVKKVKVFATSFFILYQLQSVADIVSYALVSHL